MQILSTIIVVLCWFVYVPMFIGKSGPGTERIRQDSASKWGIVFQYTGAALMWVWPRPLFTPLAETPFTLRIIAPIMAVILATGSVYFSWLALRTLGKQWSLIAGVRAEHHLIQEGPYSLVRHPLYLCFFGLTLATGMVWTMRIGLPIAILLFSIGVWIRVRSEEKILQDTFGSEFEEYRKRVPAFFPFH